MGCTASRSGKPAVAIDLAAWTLWADLDLRDEQEMMKLAKLLDALLSHVPAGADTAQDAAAAGPEAVIAKVEAIVGVGARPERR